MLGFCLARLNIYLKHGQILSNKCSLTSILFEKSNNFHSHKILLNRNKEKNTSKKLINYQASVEIRPEMTAKELAEKLNTTTQNIFDCLDTINYKYSSRRDSYYIKNTDVIIKIVKLCGFRHRFEKAKEIDYDQLKADLMAKDDSRAKRPKPKANDLIVRPPVACIMGHVDHGKTTLLDSLRGTNVVAGEFGGITQHIGAFNCRLSNSNFLIKTIERSITFLDTPGHAAFSAMRSRGAKLTDIVVLVIAAEDGLMAQTIESIEHAKAMKCQIIVAINKIDKATQEQIDKVKRELLKYNLIPEEMGGDIQVVPISALKKTNLDLLKEEIWTKAEILELKGDPKGLVEGYIIESSQDLHKGKLATILIQRGTLKKGDFLVAGNTWCRVKSILDENSNTLTSASLSQAVQLMGWKDLPTVGEEVIQIESENKVKELLEIRSKIEEYQRLKSDTEAIKEKRKQHNELYKIRLKQKRLEGKAFISDFYTDRYLKMNNKDKDVDRSLVAPASELNENNRKVSIIIKADVNGSLEAILDVLGTYEEQDEVSIDLVHFEVGQVKQSDIEMANAFNCIIYCFNVPASNIETKTEEQTGYKIKHFNVIYKLFDDLLEEINNVAPTIQEKITLGEAQILKIFDYEENKKTLKVLGGICVDGMLQSKSNFMVMRNETVLVEDLKCKTLKHLKNEVAQVKKNVNFGLSFQDDKSIVFEAGDKIICYNTKNVKKKIEWNLGF